MSTRGKVVVPNGQKEPTEFYSLMNGCRLYRAVMHVAPFSLVDSTYYFNVSLWLYVQ